MALVRAFMASPEPNDVTYARGRQVDRTYMSKSFTVQFPPQSQDYGELSRYVWKVFDEDDGARLWDQENLDIEEHVLSETPGGRKQVRVQITRQAGNIRQIEIQKVPTDPAATEVKKLLTLDRDASARLILLAKSLDHIPIEDDDETTRVDDDLLREVFSDPDALTGLYRKTPDRYRRVVQEDPDATDVVALAGRKKAVEEFRRLLTEPDYFAEARGERDREKVWQEFLEKNPWILGVGLSGQLLTAWDSQKLEKTVAGFSVSGPGKRTDAFLRSSGSIRSLVFAEIKHHETEILANRSYRTGCWAPSEELSGGVAQIQQTCYLATDQIGERLFDEDETGAETGEYAFNIRPRSFLILGHMRQLHGEQGVNRAKFRSFEMYRRNLYEPEVLTFDELLARAEWHVTLAEQDADAG